MNFISNFSKNYSHSNEGARKSVLRGNISGGQSEVMMALKEASWAIRKSDLCPHEELERPGTLKNL